MLSLITSGVKDISSSNLVQLSFFGMGSPKITLRIHKNKPLFSYSTFYILVMLDQNWGQKGM